MRNMQPFSDVVVLAIKSAMAPVLERLAATEQVNKELQARVVELSGLRDRITVMETKAAQPDVDLAPVYERIAGVELRTNESWSYIGKTVSALGERVAVVEARPTIETKSLQTPVTTELVTAQNGPSAADIELSMRDKLEPLAKEVGALRERLVAVEVRQPVPGPAGQDGKDGQNGKDGSDGLGWDDLSIGHDGERTFSVKLMRGERVKEQTFTVPVDIYRGVYVDGKSYDRGDGVTWGGSEWHCLEPTTTKPGDGSKAWVLKVKRGRDGRDGKDAPTVPVVKVP